MRLSMAYYDDAEAEFWRSLDVKAAVEANNARQARQQQVEAMRRQQEENERWAAQRAAEMQQTPVFTEVEPEPVPEQERPAEPVSKPQVDDFSPHPSWGEPVTPSTERRRYRFEAWMTDAELASFREWKNACGIGEGWTYREVV